MAQSLAIFVVVSSLVIGTTACKAPAPTDDRPNLVMIVLDTVRPDYLSAYGHPRPTSPFLESLVASGRRFDRAYSSSSWTLPAHGSLFTGTVPAVHRANQKERRLADSLPTLAERLGEAGYQTAAFSGNSWVQEPSGLARGFDHFENLMDGYYLPHVERLAKDEAGEIALTPEDHYIGSSVRTWLTDTREPRRPFFVFVNLVEPHLPYLPDWKTASEFVASKEIRWQAIRKYYPDASGGPILKRFYARRLPLTEAEWEVLRSLYEGEIRAADAVAGAIVEAVDSISDPDDTLVFVLSDHGENFGEHGHFTHLFNLYDTNLRIPLIVRGPGFRPGSVEPRRVQILDLYPTLLSVAGLAPDPSLRGVDLRSSVPEDRVLTASLAYPEISLKNFPAVFSRLGLLDDYKVALDVAIGPRFKLIRYADRSGRLVKEELYDLLDDPDELRPLSPDAVDAAALERLRGALGGQEAAATDSTSDPLEDPKYLESLKALGYIED